MWQKHQVILDKITTTLTQSHTLPTRKSFHFSAMTIEQDVIVTADMKGIKPKWPSVTSVLNLCSCRHGDVTCLMTVG